MPKVSPHNVRVHLEHIEQILDGLFEKHGWCPLVESELRKIRLFNKMILAKHRAKRSSGNRHDIYFNK